MGGFLLIVPLHQAGGDIRMYKALQTFLQLSLESLPGFPSAWVPLLLSWFLAFLQRYFGPQMVVIWLSPWKKGWGLLSLSFY